MGLAERANGGRLNGLVGGCCRVVPRDTTSTASGLRIGVSPPLVPAKGSASNEKVIASRQSCELNAQRL